MEVPVGTILPYAGIQKTSLFSVLPRARQQQGSMTAR
jgi:hypothetical protein